ncbi:MAG TPA: alanine--tRNA ligase [Clostridiales bacterium]|nr:MAG: alanine--tRNA ligase [Clostridiales bacterium GWD2_32_19]HCC06615.1 alanine--tRNA ligase [Clostridiales bacterium]
MQKFGANELRKKYLEFFESKDHLKMNSFSLVPQEDKSLLIINSGMAPLKKYFAGEVTPPNKRMTTSQKCIRTLDIDEVGKDARHLSFFEMMGNFSFGDYFKTEALQWSWEFLTKVLEMPVDKLYPSIYQDDDDAFRIWNEVIGVPKDKITRLGKDDNFWEIGVGPCGPCSEIYFDRGEKYGCGSADCKVGCDCDRYMEIWNNVFTQFSKTEDGAYVELENKNIDTGMGLERLAVVMQDVDSVFDIDTMKQIRDKICEIAKVTYGTDVKQDVSIRVINDHIRAVAFMTSDGILPSNEGRGYVLRRLLRRAARHGRILGIEGMFLTEVAKVVIENSKEAYSELEEKREHILKIIKVEEEKFDTTIDQGMNILDDYKDELIKEKKTTLSAENTFKLYDTYGFPIELTKEILEEYKINVDESGFNVLMEEQKQRARDARSETTFMGKDSTVYNKLPASIETKFVGYTENNLTSKIIAMTNETDLIDIAKAGDNVSIIVDTTPFYPEGGGQHGDIGTISGKDFKAKVLETKKVLGNKIAHICKIENGQVKVGDEVSLKINVEKRLQTARNHTATHLLQKALREVLGNHVEQSGSDVSSDRLRFDFTHFEAITNEQLVKIENIVNESILSGLAVDISEMNISDAKKIGAMALFGEKYGDKVRVVNISDYSIELCGGTHIANTVNIGLFKILSEYSVSSGVRRIEGLTGTGAVEYYKEQEKYLKMACALLKALPNEVAKKIEDIQNDLKNANKEIEKIREKMVNADFETILNTREIFNSVRVVRYVFSDVSIDEMRTMADNIKDNIKSGVIILGSVSGEYANLLVVVTDDLIAKGYHAGVMIKEMAQIIGGKGGGRPNMAQAGGRATVNIIDAIEKGIELIKGIK